MAPWQIGIVAGVCLMAAAVLWYTWRVVTAIIVTEEE